MCFKYDRLKAQLMNITEHQENAIKSLKDLKKSYPDKARYMMKSNCGTIQCFVDNQLVYENKSLIR